MPKRRLYDDERKAEFVEWLSGVLEERHLTRADLVWMLSGVRRTSPKTVDSWFRDGIVPSFPVLVALVAVFGELPTPLQDALSRPAAPPQRPTDAWSTGVRTGIADIVGVLALGPM